MSWFLPHSWSIFLLDIDFWVDKFSFLRYKWWHSSLQFLKVFLLLLRNISETNIISFAGGVICSCTAGEDSTEKQRWNIKQPQRVKIDWNKGWEEVERIILNWRGYTSSSGTGGRMGRDTHRDWSVFWVGFSLCDLLMQLEFLCIYFYTPDTEL